jgi:hypothetical protein
MHLEKNVFESTIGVLLDIKTKARNPPNTGKKGRNKVDLPGMSYKPDKG